MATLAQDTLFVLHRDFLKEKISGFLAAMLGFPLPSDLGEVEA